MKSILLMATLIFSSPIFASTDVLVSKVNLFVNSNLEYKSDEELFGKKEFWAGSKTTWELGAADCEDFAMAKFDMLKESGIPEDNMRLLFSRTREGEKHIQLLVKKDNDSVYVLDNRTDKLDTYDWDAKRISKMKSVDFWFNLKQRAQKLM